MVIRELPDYSGITCDYNFFTQLVELPDILDRAQKEDFRRCA